MVKQEILAFWKKLICTGFFHVFGANVINKIISFCSGIILVRIISKEAYGVYTYAENILSFFLLVTGLGMVNGVYQLCSEYGEDEEKSLSIYRYGGQVGLAFNVVIAISIIFFAVTYPLPVAGSNVLLLFSALIPFGSLWVELKRNYLRFTIQNQAFSYTSVFETSMTFVLSVLGAIIWKEKGLILFRYLIYFVTSIFMMCFFHVPSFKGKAVVSAFDKKALYNISFVSMGCNGLSKLLYLLDIFFLGIFVTDETIIASYKVATVIPTALTFIPQSAVLYLYPYFARHKEDKGWVKKNYLRVLKVMGIFNFFISIILIIAAPLILKLVFGEKYLDALIPFRILGVEYFFQGTFRIISGNFTSTQRKFKFNLINSAISGIANIIGNCILIPVLGSIGAALSTLIVVLIGGTISTSYMFYILRE